MIVTGASVEAWVEKRTGYQYSPARFIGIQYGELVGALVYWRFQYESGHLVDVELTFVLDRPQSFTRQVMGIMLAYPFTQLGAERVTARIGVSNTRSLRIAERLGFEREGLIRRGRFEDQWLMGVLRHGICR